MNSRFQGLCIVLFIAAVVAVAQVTPSESLAIPVAGSKLPAMGVNKTIAAADIALEKLGGVIPVSAIGEPVGGVTLAASRWVDAANGVPAYAVADAVIAPVDPNG